MASEELQTVSKEEVKNLLASNGATVVNVLESESYVRNHIKGSISIPLEALINGGYTKLDRERKVATYCASYMCSASKKAAEFLAEKGFDSYAYEGGMKEWAETGLPVESGSN